MPLETMDLEIMALEIMALPLEIMAQQCILNINMDQEIMTPLDIDMNILEYKVLVIAMIMLCKCI